MSTDTSLPVSPAPASSAVLIDAHVHLYDCYDLATFFDAARQNFADAANELDLPGDTPGVLMLTETSNDNAFQSLIDRGETNNGRWRFSPHDDGLSITASKDGRDELTVIAGKQVVTAEGLEVLALGTNHAFTEGLELRHTIQKVDQHQGLPVLPFGVGKWSGRRGQIVSNLIQDESFPVRFMLGDNAGRLALAGKPKTFEQASQKNIWTLPGTDPLPFADQAGRVGRFGLVLGQGFDPTGPGASIIETLKNLQAQPKTFGRTSGPLPFMRLQFAMQLRKRLGKR